MSNEIKEYLDTLKEIVGEGKSKGTYGISYWHWKEILDCITNLQQELERYKHYSKTTGIEELMQENERLKERLNRYNKYTCLRSKIMLDDYKSRVEKTNEYIEEHITADSNVDGDMWYTLCNNTSLDDFIINIRNFLQGGKDE